MRAYLIALFALLLCTTAMSAYTTNKIAIASNDTLYIVNSTGSNTSVTFHDTTLGEISTYYRIKAVSQKINGFVTILLNKSSGTGTQGKIAVIDTNGNIITSCNTADATLQSCLYIDGKYYCSSISSPRKPLKIFSTDCSLFTEATSGSVDTYGIAYNPTNSKLYVSHVTVGNVFEYSTSAVNATACATPVGGATVPIRWISGNYFEMQNAGNTNKSTVFDYSTCGQKFNSTELANYPSRTSTGSYIYNNGSALLEYDGANKVVFTGLINIDSGYATDQGAYVELYEPNTTQSTGNYIFFYQDYDASGTYNQNYSNYFSLSCGGRVLGEPQMPDLKVEVTDSNGNFIGNFTTDEQGKIYPNFTAGSYTLKVNYLNGQEYKSITYTANNSIGMKDMILVAGYAFDTQNQGINDVNITIYLDNAPSTNQSGLTGTSTDGFIYFYAKQSTGRIMQIATKESTEVVTYISQNKSINCLQGQVGLGAIMSSSTFYIAGTNDTKGAITPYSPTGAGSLIYVPVNVSAYDMIRMIRLKIAHNGNYLTSLTGYSIVDVQISDLNGMDLDYCNDEILGETKSVTSWADYGSYVGIPSGYTIVGNNGSIMDFNADTDWIFLDSGLWSVVGCFYTNGIHGEEVYCNSTTSLSYSEHMSVQNKGTYNVYKLKENFVVETGELTLLKVASADDQFCISQSGTGTCYLNFYCTKPTDVYALVTLNKNGAVLRGSGKLTVSSGKVIYAPPQVINSASQQYKQEILTGNGNFMPDGATCSLSLTMADGANNTYALSREGRYFTATLSPSGSERSNVSYIYYVTCSGGGVQTTSTSGTVYVSLDSNYQFTQSPWCGVSPSTFAVNTTVKLICQVGTSESTQPYNFTADVDMESTANITNIPYQSSLSSSSLRVYEASVRFQNITDGSSYTVTFNGNGFGKYANVTKTYTITINNAVTGTATIEEVKIVTTDGRVKVNKAKQGVDSLSCTASFDAEKISRASVTVYSNEKKRLFEAGTISATEYGYSKKTYVWDEVTILSDVEQFSNGKYALTHEIGKVKYCESGDYNCFKDIGLLMYNENPDNLTCIFEVNGIRANVSIPFDTGCYSYDKSWRRDMCTSMQSPEAFFAGTINLFVVAPYLIVLFFIIVTVIYVWKR